MKDYPHDEFFKYLFSLLPVVRVFLENFISVEVVECLNLATLQADDTEYITPELAAVYSDKVYRCKLKYRPETNAAIVVLMEHKSFIPLYPHLQLNEYRQRIWSTLIHNDQKPVAVLPIILYHGKDTWIKRDMSRYFGDLPDVLLPYTGNFDYILVDLSKVRDETLLQLRLGFLAYGLLTMKHSQDRDYLEKQFKVIFEGGEFFLKSEEGRIFVERLFVYYVRITNVDETLIKEKIIKTMSQNMQSAALSTYDRIILAGKAEGKIEGKAEGKIEQSLIIAERLIRQFPEMPDDQVAQISDLSVDDVRRVRQNIKSTRK